MVCPDKVHVLAFVSQPVVASVSVNVLLHGTHFPLVASKTYSGSHSVQAVNVHFIHPILV